MAFSDEERTRLLQEVDLVGVSRVAQLVGAISGPPELKLDITGSSTLKIDVNDTRRVLLRSGMFDSRCWVVRDGRHFELVAIGKTGDGITLDFEDAVVAALRRRTAPRSWAAGSTTRARILRELADEAQIPAAIETAGRGNVQAAVARSVDPEDPDKKVEKTDSWKLSGSLASDVAWRRFSDGTQLVVGSDAWLMSRFPSLAVREHTGPVHDIDFGVDVGQPTSTATLSVDAAAWVVPPGQAVNVFDQGPATGRWLVSSVTHSLTRSRASVELVRATDPLPEPEADADDADGGEIDFIPSLLQNTTSTSSATSSSTTTSTSPRAAERAGEGARERMVRFALEQAGKPYVWGASGPNSFDCSGLVQEATRAAGKVLTKPSKSQAATMKTKGQPMSVEDGINTRGAILFRMSGDPTHVVISLGNGQTIEAMGRAYGVKIGNARGRGFTSAGIWI